MKRALLVGAFLSALVVGGARAEDGVDTADESRKNAIDLCKVVEDGARVAFSELYCHVKGFNHAVMVLASVQPSSAPDLCENIAKTAHKKALTFDPGWMVLVGSTITNRSEATCKL